MISTVVRDIATSGENKLYSWQSKDNSLATRVIATPLCATADLLIETLTPLLQTIESIVFMAISAVAILAHGIVLDSRGAWDSYQMTMINLNEATINAIRSIVKPVLAPLMLLGQIWLTAVDHPNAKPMSENFTRFECNPPGMRLFDPYAPFGTKLALEIPLSRLLGILFAKERLFAETHPVCAKILAVPLALLDTIGSIAIPLIKTIQAVIKTVIVLFLIPSCEKGISIESTKLEISGLNYTVNCLAQTLSMIALSPITLISQLFSTLLVTKKADTSIISLYTFCSKREDKTFTAYQKYLTSKGVASLNLSVNMLGPSFTLQYAGVDPQQV